MRTFTVTLTAAELAALQKAAAFQEAGGLENFTDGGEEPVEGSAEDLRAVERAKALGSAMERLEAAQPTGETSWAVWVTDKTGPENIFTEVGDARSNRDGSIALRLRVYPVANHGKFTLRPRGGS